MPNNAKQRYAKFVKLNKCASFDSENPFDKRVIRYDFIIIISNGAKLFLLQKIRFLK